MKCPKCSAGSFNYAQDCKRCGAEFLLGPNQLQISADGIHAQIKDALPTKKQCKCGVYNDADATRCWGCRAEFYDKEGAPIPDVFMPAASTVTVSPETTLPKYDGQYSVVVTDFNMPFGSMVTFMVKWSIASIPAAIILVIIFLIFGAIFGGIIGSMF